MSPDAPTDRFQNPTRECDLVMKGGITSGVVYPRAILRLAEDYRLVQVGGTSAGAIAASFAAAAEFARTTGGFERLEKVPDELSEHLEDLFQPHPKHRKSFQRAKKLYEKKINPVGGLVTAIRHVPTFVALWKTVKTLPETNYGICPGITQRRGGLRLGKHKFPGLTDWLDQKLEWLAGRDANGKPPERPLTFGLLDEAGVTLRTIATDLSGQSPVLLPFDQRTWMFRESEFRQLFPEHIVDWLVAKGKKDKDDDPRDDHYFLPQTSDLPVLLTVRLSLSFPVLLAAIPLYRKDYGYKTKEERETPRRCWMSDGGITSNFPIHLFDSLLPARPTFGFSLDAFDERRSKGDPADPENRVDLPSTAKEGLVRPIRTFEGIGGFAGAILNSARNWQDSLQSVLPGYRERIVHVALDENEGGLNLTMPPDLIAKLGQYGDIAGARLLDFDLGEHRWRRLLSTYSSFEQCLEELIEEYENRFRDDVKSHDEKSYPKSKKQRQKITSRIESLLGVGRLWIEDERLREKRMPNPPVYLRAVPKEQAGVTDGTVMSEQTPSDVVPSPS